MTNDNFIALIDKYLNATASESERRLVDEYLTRLEANQTVLPEIEEQAIKGEMWEKILMETTQQAKPFVRIAWYKRKTVRQIAIAASILLMVGLGILFLQDNNKTGDKIVAVPNGWQADSTHYFVRHEVNTTGKEKNLKLTDGTLIILYNNSDLTYREPFANKRDITLIGKAFFKVAKDKARPFTVLVATFQPLHWERNSM